MASEPATKATTLHCDADEFIQEAERILRNFRMDDGTAVEWLIQALEGSAWREVVTRAAGEADTAAQVLAVLAATFGDHTAGCREWGRV